MIDTTIGRCEIVDIPTVDLEGGGLIKRRVQGRELALLIRQMVPAGNEPLVFLEQVGAMGGKDNAIQTQASLAGTFYSIRTVLDILRWPPELVLPQRWKGTYGLKRTAGEKDSAYKGRHLALARKLYPSAPLHLAKHHNRAEALLLAHFGVSKL